MKYDYNITGRSANGPGETHYEGSVEADNPKQACLHALAKQFGDNKSEDPFKDLKEWSDDQVELIRQYEANTDPYSWHYEGYEHDFFIDVEEHKEEGKEVAMLKLSDLERGHRISPDYVGTIIEIVEEIPESANAACRGQPGVLVYWHATDTKGATMEQIYHAILPKELTRAEDFETSKPQWIPLSKLQKYPPEAFGSKDR